MSTSTVSVVHARNHLANATKGRDPDRIHAAREALTAAKVQRAIEQGLAEAPPLTPEARQRLAALLVGGGSVE